MITTMTMITITMAANTSGKLTTERMASTGRQSGKDVKEQTFKKYRSKLLKAMWFAYARTWARNGESVQKGAPAKRADGRQLSTNHQRPSAMLKAALRDQQIELIGVRAKVRYRLGDGTDLYGDPSGAQPGGGLHLLHSRLRGRLQNAEPGGHHRRIGFAVGGSDKDDGLPAAEHGADTAAVPVAYGRLCGRAALAL